MEDLPAELMIDILSRLPVKTVIHCKCVCKKWRSLVLDSSFVDLHLSRSPIGLATLNYRNHRIEYSSRVLGILKWVEIEGKVDHQHLHQDPPISLDLNLVPIFQNSPIYQMGSLNGLTCLWQRSRHYNYDNTYICNPVTREILFLPSSSYYKKYFTKVLYGFGVSSLTGEYKVVRSFRGEMRFNGNQSYRISVLEAEVYTLGTGQWRSLGPVPYKLHHSYYFHGAFLNNHCHWIVSEEEEEDVPEKICTFDLNKETFQLFPSPPFEEESSCHLQSLAVLKGCLCKSDGNDSQFTIWVMKEYGIKKSWHKEVVITEAFTRGLLWDAPIFLIEGLEDGSILFLNMGLWVFYPRSDTLEEIETIEWLMTGQAYRPSFIKLQDFESERVHMF